MQPGKSFLLACLMAATALGQSYDQRAQSIVQKMTLDEKIEELHGIQNKSHQRYVPGIKQLSIPWLRITNGPAGVGPGDTRPQAPATALPAPISLAASWDVNLAHLYGVIVGKEARDLADGLVEGPDINIMRVPQNGRTFEAFGEDPYLVSRMAVHEIEGLQSERVIADVKHYVANNQEADRFSINERVGERALHEIYLPAFKASVEEAHAGAVMCAYPKVNGAFNCQNELLLNQVLKKDWGFKGFVTSDFGATHSTVRSATAGLDLEMPTGIYFGDKLKQAVQSGRVPVGLIDDKLERRFRTMMELGVYDRPPTGQRIPAKEDGAIARRIAEEGIVLLKNKGGLLPLDKSQLHSIAVIGPYGAQAMTGGGGSSHVVPLYTVGPVEGIERRAGRAVTVRFDDGADVAKAAALARSSDVAIVMVGDHETEGRDHPITLEGDQNALVEAVAGANPRTIIVLKSGSAVLMPWVNQVPAIIEAWYLGEEDGNAVAAVLFGDVNPSGKLPITFPQSLEQLPAATPEQYPGMNGVVHYSEGIFVGYRHYDEDHLQPLFAFGYGLSYTTFAFKHLTITPATLDFDFHSVRCPPLDDACMTQFLLSQPITATVDFDVKNTGHRAGAAVAELYLGFPSSAAVPEPPKQLEGFARVELRRGQTRHVRLFVDLGSLAYWNVAAHHWATLPGTYKVMVGDSSRDILLNGELHVKPESSTIQN